MLNAYIRNEERLKKILKCKLHLTQAEELIKKKSIKLKTEKQEKINETKSCTKHEQNASKD